MKCVTKLNKEGIIMNQVRIARNKKSHSVRIVCVCGASMQVNENKGGTAYEHFVDYSKNDDEPILLKCSCGKRFELSGGGPLIDVQEIAS